MYIMAFERLLEARKGKEKSNVIWFSGVDVMRWWLRSPGSDSNLEQEEFDMWEEI
jgi:hypothetical protein